ncbi:MAG: ABC transporter ATP-binding protein [Synergistaceae bacterium]|nr:ABC transporter ATP-binding protein [Synergistaceae bacterium]
MPIIEVKDLVKIYKTGDIELRALDGITCSIEHGEFVCIMGPSGSGKSTMMNILGCLDVLTSGEYILDGVSVRNQNRAALADIRNHKIGFVFQGYNLLQKADALENVEMPLMYRGVPSSKRRKLAKEALESVGLETQIHKRPVQMSGGQQQRVAIARAIVGKAPILMADEPTGALDTKTSVEIMQIFTELHKEGTTIILVTHEPDIATWSDRVLRFRDGKLVADETPEKISKENEAKPGLVNNEKLEVRN